MDCRDIAGGFETVEPHGADITHVTFADKTTGMFIARHGGGPGAVKVSVLDCEFSNESIGNEIEILGDREIK